MLRKSRAAPGQISAGAGAGSDGARPHATVHFSQPLPDLISTTRALDETRPRYPKRKPALASAPSASSTAARDLTGRTWLTRPGRWLRSQTRRAAAEVVLRRIAAPTSRTLLTVLTVFSRVARIRMTLCLARPSLLKAIRCPRPAGRSEPGGGGRRARGDVFTCAVLSSQSPWLKPLRNLSIGRANAR